MDQGFSGKSSNSGGGVIETVDVKNSQEIACVSGENGDSELKVVEESTQVFVEMLERVMDQETCDLRGIGETGNREDTSGNTGTSADGRIGERFGVVDMNENPSNSVREGNSEAVDKEMELKVLAGKSKKYVNETEKNSCVIDMGKLDENWDGERVCRICHLSSEQSPKSSDAPANAIMDLIQLGCGCKYELGIAHIHCAEAWFKLKGNRFCEICGETAKNVTGVGVSNSLEDWNERRLMGISNDSSNRRCWRGQPFCNFLMACLVIAFVLPWFFRINMF